MTTEFDKFFADIAAKEKDLQDLKDKMETQVRQAAEKLGYILAKKEDITTKKPKAKKRIDGLINTFVKESPRTEKEITEKFTSADHSKEDIIKLLADRCVGDRILWHKGKDGKYHHGKPTS